LSTKQVLLINSQSNSLGIIEGDIEAIVGTLSLTGSNSGVIDARIISTNADGAWSVTTADVDGDGDIDVLSASLNDDKIAWYDLNLAPQFSLFGEDAGQFEIVEQELKLKTGVVTDYETKSSYSVTVIATDPNGTDYSKDFDITIKDIAETPTGINLLGPLSGAILPKTSSFSDNY
jgi:hypothetical protein